MTSQTMDIADEVLLLDDDPAMLVFLEGILTGAGYTCLTETDPEAALSQVAAREQIGLVLSDVYMPGLTGLQFIDRLRALPLNRPTPRVLLLTAQPSMEAAIDALRLGAEDFLLKPIRPPELVDAMARALSRSRADRALSATRAPEVQQLVQQAEELAGRLRSLAYSRSVELAEPPAELVGNGGQTAKAKSAAKAVSSKMDDASGPVLLSVIDTIEQLRRLRERYAHHAIDDVEWDLLLELLRAERLHQRMSVSALTVSATGASTTTSLRRVNQLVARGYIVRIPDQSDARRDFVSLTSKSHDLLTDYLARANIHLRDLLA